MNEGDGRESKSVRPETTLSGKSKTSRDAASPVDEVLQKSAARLDQPWAKPEAASKTIKSMSNTQMIKLEDGYDPDRGASMTFTFNEGLVV